MRHALAIFQFETANDLLWRVFGIDCVGHGTGRHPACALQGNSAAGPGTDAPSLAAYDGLHSPPIVAAHTMNPLVLFYAPGSCALATHILLEETGEPYQLDKRDVFSGQTRTPEYLRINPKGRVPALRIDGQDQVLTELPAICWYISRNAPALRPQGDVAEARSLEWFNWLSGTLHATAFGALWSPQRFADDSTVHPALQAKARAAIQGHFASIEERLAQNAWAVDERYGLVDPFLLVFYKWGLRIGMAMNQYPAWSRHARQVLARPACERAFEQEGLAQRYRDIVDYIEGRLAHYEPR